VQQPAALVYTNEAVTAVHSRMADMEAQLRAQLAAQGFTGDRVQIQVNTLMFFFFFSWFWDD
jgi:hypothetical protein